MVVRVRVRVSLQLLISHGRLFLQRGFRVGRVPQTSVRVRFRVRVEVRLRVKS